MKQGSEIRVQGSGPIDGVDREDSVRPWLTSNELSRTETRLSVFKALEEAMGIGAKMFGQRVA